MSMNCINYDKGIETSRSYFVVCVSVQEDNTSYCIVCASVREDN